LTADIAALLAQISGCLNIIISSTPAAILEKASTKNPWQTII
jgi:hypothetical protein